MRKREKKRGRKEEEERKCEREKAKGRKKLFLRWPDREERYRDKDRKGGREMGEGKREERGG